MKLHIKLKGNSVLNTFAIPRRNRRGNVTNSYSEWKDGHHPIIRYHWLRLHCL